jgi:hypothetical protein
MAKQKEKKGYQGPKLVGDSSDYRKKAKVRAEKNSPGFSSNAAFSASDQEFLSACEKAGIAPSQRQASKFRNGYGKAAHAVNRSTRKPPN